MAILKEYIIGGCKIDVEEVDGLMDGESLLYGNFSQMDGKAKIARFVNGRPVHPDVREVTQYHEVLHSMFRTAGFDFDAKQEEEIVTRLAYLFYEFEKTKVYRPEPKATKNKKK